MGLIERLVIWWLTRRVAVAKAELHDVERQIRYLEGNELLASDDLRQAEERLARRLRTTSNIIKLRTRNT